MQTLVKQINGIDTQALRDLVREVAEQPERGVARFQVTNRWLGGTRTEARVEAWELGGRRLERNFTFQSDEPPELGGACSAPNPQEILMAGLNACMMVGYVAGCALHGIELESLEIETEGDLDLRGFLGIDPDVRAGYDEIRYRVRIRGNATPEQFRQVHETVMATSPNYWNISRPIRLRPELIVE